MIVGIDLGGMSAKAACLQNNALTERVRVETSANSSAEETAEALAELSKSAASAAGISYDEIEAIGIGSPGVIDSACGNVVLWSNFNWRNIPLASLVAAKTGKRVFVTNDANAAALGEAKYGAGAKYEDSILLTLGTGVGGGIILGGKLFEGFKSAGTEIGHMVIRQNGELCTCGRRGCLERYASASGLIRMTEEHMRAHPESLLHKYKKQDGHAGGKTAFLAAREGDSTAKEVVAEYVAALGEGIANLVNLLRPQAVLLGGGVAYEGDNLLIPLREFVRPRLYVSDEYAPLDILCATLGNDAGLYGAAEYARSRL